MRSAQKNFRPLGLVALLCSLLIISCTSKKTVVAYKYNGKYSKRSSTKTPRPVARQQTRENNRSSTSSRSNSNKRSNNSEYYGNEYGEYPEVHYENCNASLSHLMSSLNRGKETVHISIDKSEYKLSVYSRGQLLKEYPVVFGKNPKGEKLMQGDKKTPEGEFKVRAAYPHKTWEKFIWIDYPTAESYAKHNNAKARGVIPRDARIGGEIGIHGVPDDKNYAITERQNWTLGCIAMKNQDVNELYAYVSTDMSLEIFE